MDRRGGFLSVFVLTFAITAVVAFAQEDEDLGSGEQGKGLIPFTEEQEKQFRKEHKKIEKINLNEVGWERVNKERKKRGYYELDSEFKMPKGKDIEASFIEESLSGSATQTPQSAGSAEAMGVLPAYVDNSKTVWFPPIRSQGSLNSCVSFAATYTQLSYMVAFQKGLTINTSDNTNKYSPKWTYNMVNGGSNSGTYFSDNYNLLKLHGAALWSEFPYDSDYLGWCLNPLAWRTALSVRANPVQYVYNVSTSTGLDQLKQLLTNGYILVFGTYINSWQYTILKDDPMTADDDAFVGKSAAYWMNGTNGAHAMVIVGYNDALWVDVNNNNVLDAGEKGALRIANSWGTGWGDAGFTWLAYDGLKSISGVNGGPSTGRVKAIMSDMGYQITVKDNYSPKLIAEFTVSHLKRDQLRMSLGVSDLAATIPSTTWYPFALSLKGGPYAFNGTPSTVDGTFVLDFTDIAPLSSSTMRYYVGMYDNVLGDSAELKSYKLVDLVNNREVYSNTVPQTADASQLIYALTDYSYFDGNYAPTAVIAVNPVSGIVPLAVVFDASASSDSDGSISSFAWDFGDTTQASGANVSHTYSKEGSYTAKLTVTDNLGATAQATVDITVSADPNILAAPSGLSSKLSGSVCTLQWTDNSANEEGFYIEQGAKIKGGGVVYKRLAQVTANTLQYSFSIGKGSSYYRVQAFNTQAPYSSGNPQLSAYSNEIQVRVR